MSSCSQGSDKKMPMCCRLFAANTCIHQLAYTSIKFFLHTYTHTETHTHIYKTWDDQVRGKYLMSRWETLMKLTAKYWDD